MMLPRIPTMKQTRKIAPCARSSEELKVGGMELVVDIPVTSSLHILYSLLVDQG